MTLLDRRFEPITSQFSFLEAKLDQVARWWTDFENRTIIPLAPRRIFAEQRDVEGSLADLLGLLPPLTVVERRRALFVATESNWTAVFENSWQGGDPSPVKQAARELGCRAVWQYSVPHVVVKGRVRRYGGRLFELSKGAACVRSVAVTNDGGRWQMDMFGDPLPAERSDWYTATRTRDRFTEQHLEALLASVGIRAYDEAFYGRCGVLVERFGRTVPGFAERSLSEVQAEWR